MPLRLAVYFNSLITEIHRKNMSYKYLEHATDAFIEVRAKTMEEEAMPSDIQVRMRFIVKIRAHTWI